MLNILQEADALTSGDRQDQYGHPADTYAPVAALWTAYLEGLKYDPKTDILEARNVCMMLALMKIGREMVVEKRDNIVDAAGYLRTVEMIHEREMAEMTDEMNEDEFKDIE